MFVNRDFRRWATYHKACATISSIGSAAEI
jgi:hypothetical protein